jgi:hypothetical protein
MNASKARLSRFFASDAALDGWPLSRFALFVKRRE